MNRYSKLFYIILLATILIGCSSCGRGKTDTKTGVTGSDKNKNDKTSNSESDESDTSKSDSKPDNSKSVFIYAPTENMTDYNFFIPIFDDVTKYKLYDEKQQSLFADSILFFVQRFDTRMDPTLYETNFLEKKAKFKHIVMIALLSKNAIAPAPYRFAEITNSDSFMVRLNFATDFSKKEVKIITVIDEDKNPSADIKKQIKNIIEKFK